MSKLKGKRYSETERAKILKYSEKHTWREVTEKYGVSYSTVMNWNKKGKKKSLPEMIEIQADASMGAGQIVLTVPNLIIKAANVEVESNG